MDKVIKFLNNPNTVKIVLNSIKQKVNLPNKGFMAGGAVSNMLLSLYHKGTPWTYDINDVDIFIIEDDKYDDNIQKLGLGGFRTDWDYNEYYEEGDGSFYKLNSCDRDGLINTILCSVHTGYQTRKIRFRPYQLEDRVYLPVDFSLNGVAHDSDHNHETILDGFDINCCQSGINLETGKIHYTDNFLKFLYSKQIELTNPGKPASTLGRLLSKIDFYGDLCFCDLNKELDFIKILMDKSSLNYFFGEETYDKYYHKIDKRLEEIVDITYDHENANYHIEFKHTYDKDEYKYLLDLLTKQHQDYWFVKLHFELLHRGVTKVKLNKIKTLFGCIDSELGYDEFFIRCLLYNKDYLDCDFHENHIKYIQKTLNSHYLISRNIDKLNIQKQYNICKYLKIKSNELGLYVYGLLESIEIDLFDDVRDMVDKIILDDLNESKRNLCEPLDLSGFKYRNNVTELVSKKSLRDEGVKMNHCVGGYSNRVEIGLYKIFHIEVDGVGSTLEIKVNEELNQKDFSKIKITQHNSYGNRRPENKNRGIAFKLCYYLVNKYLPKEKLNEIDKSIQIDRIRRNQIIKSEKKIHGEKYVKLVSRPNNITATWFCDGHATRRQPFIRSNFWDEPVMGVQN